LTTITDARPQLVLTNVYDQTTLRVSSQTDALTNQTSYSYPSSIDGTTPTVVTYPTTSADPSWNAKAEDIYGTTLPSFLIKHTDKPASTSSTWASSQFAYDANGFSSTLADPKGNVTTFCFDRAYDGTAITTSRGKLGRVIAPVVTDARSGSSVHPVTLYKYDSHNNLTETVAPDGVTSSSTTGCSDNLSGSINSLFATDNTYDASGVQLLSTVRTFTDPDLTGQQTATTQYQYNDSNNPGRVTAVISPRNNTRNFGCKIPANLLKRSGPASTAC